MRYTDGEVSQLPFASVRRELLEEIMSLPTMEKLAHNEDESRRPRWLIPAAAAVAAAAAIAAPLAVASQGGDAPAEQSLVAAQPRSAAEPPAGEQSTPVVDGQAGEGAAGGQGDAVSPNVGDTVKLAGQTFTIASAAGDLDAWEIEFVGEGDRSFSLAFEMVDFDKWGVDRVKEADNPTEVDFFDDADREHVWTESTGQVVWLGESTVDEEGGVLEAWTDTMNRDAFGDILQALDSTEIDIETLLEDAPGL